MTLKENFKLRAFIRETIRKIGDEYVVYPKRGGKRLGTHKTKAAAEKQVTAIHLSKALGENKTKDKLGFYLEYYKNLTPSNLSVDKKDKNIIISGFENTLSEADPKKGTGKKPKGSGRRLYTDEDPTDTVKVKFRTKQDIVDTFNKTSFKNKSHARQSQIINLVHQRVRAAYQNAKDPDVKKRLKTALDYAEKRKEASKKKTQRLKNEMLNYPNWLRFQAQTPGNFPDGEHRFRLPKKKKKLKETAGIMTAAEKAKHEKNMLRLRKILNKQPNSYIPYPDIPNTLQRKLHDKSLPEASYEGNMGFEEMFKFYQQATEKQIELLEKLIDEDKVKEAWKLVQKVVGVKLVGKEFNEQNESNKLTVASLAKRHNRTESTIRIALKRGIEKELTYVNDVLSAREIALDNLYDDPDYYAKISQLNV